MSDEDENYSPYCVICGACGEDGCCPATVCKHASGEYCDYYLKLLKATYIAHQKILDELSEELQIRAIDILFEEMNK